jgi:hypothetical protein
MLIFDKEHTMSIANSRLMGGASALLRALILLNIICFGFVAAVLLGSFAFESVYIAQMAEDFPKVSPEAKLGEMRLAFSFATPMLLLTHLLLTRMREIVATVQSGDPFVAVNAGRLTMIAWAVLGIQILTVGYSMVNGVRSVRNLDFSLTSWLAVLLLFVLARVFEHGSRMRDDLAGTI